MPVDYKLYPPHWLTEIRPRILARACHRCEACGVANYAFGYRDKKGRFIEAPQFEKGLPMMYDLFDQHLRPAPIQEEAITIVLTIAHLDRDYENWDVADDRLKCLCQRCHFEYDQQANQEAVKYGKFYKKNQLKLDLD